MNTGSRLLVLGSNADASSTPDTGPLLPWHVDGRHFKRPDGTIEKLLGLTAFRDFELYLKGAVQQKETYDSWAYGLGYRVKAVFAFHNPGHDPFVPSMYPDYYAKLPEYFAYEASRGWRIQFVSFAGAVPGFDPFITPGEQDAHQEKIRQAMSAVHFGMIGNESDKNGPDVYRFTPSQTAGVLYSRTRLTEFTPDEYAKQLDWLAFEPERKDSDNVVRQMKGIHDITQDCLKPCYATEPEKVDNMTPLQYRAYALLAQMFGPGLNVHGSWDNLQQCLVPTGSALDCCVQAAQVCRSGLIPPEAADWPYTRDEQSVLKYPGPDIVQHHYELNNGSRAIVGITEPHSPYVHEAIPGWTIVQDDPVGCYLERV